MNVIVEILAERAATALAATEHSRRTDRIIEARDCLKWWLAYGAKPRRARYIERRIEWLEEVVAANRMARRFCSFRQPTANEDQNGGPSSIAAAPFSS